MMNSYENICKTFNIGRWSIDTKEHCVLVDQNLADILKSGQLSIPYDHFVGLIVPGQREAVAQLIGALPTVLQPNCRMMLLIEGQVYHAEAFFDSHSDGEYLIHGCARIEPAEGTDQLYDIGEAVEKPRYARPISVYAELKEHNLRTLMKCKLGLIYPISLSIETRIVELSLVEQGLMVKKKFTLTEFIDAIHPDDRTQFVEEFQQFANNPEHSIYQTFRTKILSENHLWYELLSEIMPNDLTGKPEKYIGVLRNVHSKYLNEEMIRNSNELLNNIYQNIPIGVELYDKNAKLIEINSMALEIFGLTHPQTVIGLNLFEDPSLPEEFKNDLRQGKTAEASIIYNFESCAHPYFPSNKSGNINLFSKCAPLYDAQGILSNYLMIHLDDTEKISTRSRLKDFENIFSGIAAFARIGYCKYNPITKDGFAIDQWYENMGEKMHKSIMGGSFSNYSHIHPEDMILLSKAYNGLISGEISSLQYNVRIEVDNQWKWTYLNIIVTEHDIEHNNIVFVGINIDITAFKESELMLIESNRVTDTLLSQRDMILSNISAGIIYIDTDYVVQWASSGALKALRPLYIPGQICYRTAFNRDEPCLNCPLAKMMIIKERTTHEITENENTLEVDANPIFNSQGEMTGGVIQLSDVTLRKQQERKINALNQLMESILDNVPNYLFVKNPNDDFKYVYWNKAMAEHTQILAAHALGKRDIDIFPSVVDAEHFLQDDLHLLETKTNLVFQEQYIDVLGEEHVVNTIKTLIPTEDTYPWILGVSWDITDLKRKEKELIRAKEKAEESDKFKSSFLANMSHEIRTPLNAIIGFSELLTDNTVEKEDREEYCSIIQKNNSLLLQLISDILDLSRIEAHVLQLNEGEVNLNELCSRVATSSNLRTKSSVPILFDDTLEPYHIFSDENRIQQVITNLVNNAMKFTTQGKIEIGYKLINEKEVEIYVQDTGRGIPKDKINSIFERFVKLDSFAQGTGLGLSICKSLVEQLNGYIGVESTENVGARFYFTLPYQQPIEQQEDNSAQ